MDIKSKLNEKQYLAASSTAKHLRIIAGAGTGKTRTLSYRIAYLISQGIRPHRMVAITFTNKAAKEMLTRVDGLLEENEVPVFSKPIISTFHGFCYRFLRKEIEILNTYTKNFSIASEEDTNAIYKDIFSNMPKGNVKDYVKAITHKIGALKTDGVFVEELTEEIAKIPKYNCPFTFDEVKRVYEQYQHILTQQNMLDFDDLLMLTVKIMEDHPDIRSHWRSKFDVFLVDEFQDTNALQYHLILLFMSSEATLTVVGDPDQTIYTWRGAKNEIIKKTLSQTFPDLETVVLDDNYRSTQNILDAANKLISKNTDRVAKNLNAASGVKGEEIDYRRYPDAENEGRAIALEIRRLQRDENINLSDIAVIYRSNYLSNPIEKQLTANRVPYAIYGGLKFFERAEIKDALAYLRLALNPDDFSFERILKAPSKGLGKKTMEYAKFYRDQLDPDMSLMTYFREHSEPLKLTKPSRAKMDQFFACYDDFMKVYNNENTTPSEMVTAIRKYFETTGFMEYVQREDVKTADKLSFTAATSNSKVDNVNELLRTITDFFDHEIAEEDGTMREPTLDDFLIDVALQSAQDEIETAQKVSLMTGHVSKGLEFPVVFVVGLNDGTFPTIHALMDAGNAIEEERRLLYVCMTRAEKKLYLSSYGGYNFRSGSPLTQSIFLKEIGFGRRREAEEKNYDSYVGGTRQLFKNISENAKPIISAASNKTPSDQKDDYAVGDKVIHATFGKGVVTEIQGGKYLITDFGPQFGTKKLIIGFKMFRKLKEDE